MCQHDHPEVHAAAVYNALPGGAYTERRGGGFGYDSPNFLHFVCLDRGRHPGLPLEVAKVTRRSP
jgi:hypothetical protein